MSELRVKINNKLVDIDDLKVTELKAELKKRGVSTAGRKEELQEKLKNHLLQHSSSSQVEATSETLNLNDTGLSQNVSNIDLSLNADASSDLDQKSSMDVSQQEPAPVNGTPCDEANTDKAKRVNSEAEDNEQEQQQSQPKRLKNNDNDDDNKEKQQVVVSIKEDLVVAIDNQVEMTTATVAVDKVSISQSDTETNNSNGSRSQSRDRSSSVDLLNDNKVTSVDNTNQQSRGSSKSESAFKEIPMSGDRNRFSRSRSPKSRWHAPPTPDPESTDGHQDNVVKPMEETKEAVKMETDTKDDHDDATAKIPNDESTSATLNTSSTTTDPVIDDIPKVQRKRKWFNNESQKIVSTTQIVSISSDTLKSYLPEVKATKVSPSDDINHLSTDSIGSNGHDLAVTRKVLKSDESKRLVEDDQTLVKRQHSRTVIMEEENNELIYEDALNTNDLNRSATEAKDDQKPLNQKDETGQQQLTSDQDTEMERAGDASPAHNPISNIIHIKGLTRPFTLNQLKELLSKHGKLIESQFWMNTVKSHCYAAFESVEGAQAAREALHAIRWPQSNPRTLRVDYGTEDEMNYYKKNEEKPTATVAKPEAATKDHKQHEQNEQKIGNHKTDHKETTSTSKHGDKSTRRSTSRNRDRDSGRKRKDEPAEKERPVREWDLPKLRGSRSRSRDISMERRRRADQDKRAATERKVDKKKDDEPPNGTVAAEEPPAKMLDDLFKKTKATPYIYWLPLTDEQYEEKERQRELRMEERRQREIEREKRENNQQTTDRQENGKRASSHTRNNSVERKNEPSEVKNSSDDRAKRDDNNDIKKNSSSSRQKTDTNDRRRRSRSRSTDRRRETQRR